MKKQQKKIFDNLRQCAKIGREKNWLLLKYCPHLVEFNLIYALIEMLQFLDCGPYEFSPQLDLNWNSTVNLKSKGFPLQYEPYSSVIWNVTAPVEFSIEMTAIFFKVILFAFEAFKIAINFVWTLKIIQVD